MLGISSYFLAPSVITLLAGIAILIWPRLLSYIVAFYLILFGLMGIIGAIVTGPPTT